MKLQSFVNDPEFLRALTSVGAPYIPWEPDPPPLSEELTGELQRGLVEIKEPNKILTDDAGLLVFKGHKVVVYIRDQHAFSQYGMRLTDPGASNYKYHLTKCATIHGMQSQGRYKKRYVYTTRKDGFFVVNRMDYGKVINKDHIVKMDLCMNCWNHLLSMGITEKYGLSIRSFDLDKFFKMSDTLIPVLPVHTPQSAPLNEYSEDQAKLSNILRRKYKHVCQKCNVDFSSDKEFLHMHHKDRQKSNNDSSNLTIYCLACHAEEPGHQQLKRSWQYERAVVIRNRAKG